MIDRAQMLASGVDLGELADRWWALAVRGALAILFGILTFANPGATIYFLVLTFGIFALLDGAFTALTGLRSRRTGLRWGWMLFHGLAGVAFGIATIAWPAITALVFIYLMAAWAMSTGMAQIGAAIRLRKVITGEWMLALGGALSIGLGVMLVLFPGPGLVVMAWWIATYAVAFGLLLLALGFRLRRWAHGGHPPTATGGMPHPA